MSGKANVTNLVEKYDNEHTARYQADVTFRVPYMNVRTIVVPKQTDTDVPLGPGETFEGTFVVIETFESSGEES
ncbi:hypothetical protein SARC_15875, partial [Sphaeroforma arctica JP610]